MPSHPDDLALVELIISGDQDAAEAFCRQYQSRFAYLARRAGVPRQDYEDVAQEILIAAINQMQRGLFRGDSGLGTWLDRIAQGKIADYWRSRTRIDRLVPIASINQSADAPISEHIPEAIPEYSGAGVDFDMVLQVREVLKQMRAPERALLLLKFFEGYTIEEISRATGLTANQVGGRLFRAEERFRRLLNGETIDRPPMSRSRQLKKGDETSEQ